MNKQLTAKGVVLAAMGALAAGQAQAITFTQGDWALDINGTINGFYVQSSQKTKNLATGVTTTNDRANVQNGLLPGWINFVATTKQNGWDVKGHISFAPGINQKSEIVGLPAGANPGSALSAYSSVDSRNVYLQFGKPDTGSFKFGRDIGLFMQNAVLSDMTLLGVGGTVRAAEPFNTSFGMIGHGYMYVGFQPQITYSTPNMGGLQGAIGLFNPSQYDPVAGTEKKTPGVQGLLSYDWKGSANGKVWGAFVNQKTQGTGGRKADGFEGGVKIGMGPFEAVVAGFTAKGLGISTVGAQFFGGADATGGRLKSSGYFAQGTFQATQDLKLGISTGQNTDKKLVATGDQKNQAVALGAYYKLTPSVTLVGELVNEKLTTTAVSETKTRNLNLGAILFF